MAWSLTPNGCQCFGFFIVSADALLGFQNGRISDDFRAELKQALASLNAVEGVAVRSSAIGEEPPDSSFAGRYQTVLGLHRLDNHISAIQECWAFYQNVAAQTYPGERVSDEHGGAMAIVIRKLLVGGWLDGIGPKATTGGWTMWPYPLVCGSRQVDGPSIWGMSVE